MSTAGLYWSAKAKPRRWLGAAWVAIVCLLWCCSLTGQATDAIASANQQKAQAVLAAAIQALGGPAWLDLRSSRSQAQMASFFQGTPTGKIAAATVTVELPRVDIAGKERIDFDKGHVVQIFSGRSGWEITYKGKKDLPEEKLDDHLRWQAHSLGMALRDWYRNPATVLIDEGPSQVERHPAEKITLIHTGNGGSANGGAAEDGAAKNGFAEDGVGGDAVTLEIDAESHLPLRLRFAWRDPQFHDKNLDAVEYDNYHRIDGIATPFTVTRTHNGQIVYQRYVLRTEYNVTFPNGLFDPARAAAHLK